MQSFLPSEYRFTEAVRSLAITADVNRVGVTACFEHYNECPCEESERMLARSLAYGFQQVHHMNRELILLALDYEDAAAATMDVGS